jgi:hypothetical protein
MKKFSKSKYEARSRAIRFFISSAITSISGTDVIPNKYGKVAVFLLGIVLVAIQALDMIRTATSQPDDADASKP